MSQNTFSSSATFNLRDQAPNLQNQAPNSKHTSSLLHGQDSLEVRRRKLDDKNGGGGLPNGVIRRRFVGKKT